MAFIATVIALSNLSVVCFLIAITHILDSIRRAIEDKKPNE